MLAWFSSFPLQIGEGFMLQTNGFKELSCDQMNYSTDGHKVDITYDAGVSPIDTLTYDTLSFLRLKLLLRTHTFADHKSAINMRGKEV